MPTQMVQIDGTGCSSVTRTFPRLVMAAGVHPWAECAALCWSA